MADDPDRVKATFTAAAQSSDALQVRGANVLHNVGVIIYEIAATWAATVDVEIREAGDTTWRVERSLVIAAGAFQNIQIPLSGSWDLRLTTSAYTGGQAEAFLKE